MDITDDFKIQPIPNIPSQIQEAAEHGELVVFIGAGCSCLLGYPNWEKYSNDALTQILGAKRVFLEPPDRSTESHWRAEIRAGGAGPRAIEANTNIKSHLS